VSGRGDRRVVVGVDGSGPSRAALRRAAEEARTHEAVLEVVAAWSFLDQATGAPFDPQYGEATVRTQLEQIVKDELGDEPVPSLALRVENDLPARALLAAADGAWLVVVGSRGIGGFKGLLLGSVSTQLAHHAPCPVLIVRGQETIPSE
jgi:nucleotide-binding universal stress UspA family protein